MRAGCTRRAGGAYKALARRTGRCDVDDTGESGEVAVPLRSRLAPAPSVGMDAVLAGPPPDGPLVEAASSSSAAACMPAASLAPAAPSF